MKAAVQTACAVLCCAVLRCAALPTSTHALCSAHVTCLVMSYSGCLIHHTSKYILNAQNKKGALKNSGQEKQPCCVLVFSQQRSSTETCLIAAANSMASEAEQVDMGVSAAAEFQPSGYSILLKVTLPIGSITQIELCMACHKVFCHCNEAVCGQGSPVKATLHLCSHPRQKTKHAICYLLCTATHKVPDSADKVCAAHFRVPNVLWHAHLRNVQDFL